MSVDAPASRRYALGKRVERITIDTAKLPCTLPTTCPDCLGPKLPNRHRCESCREYRSDCRERKRRDRQPLGEPVPPELMRTLVRVTHTEALAKACDKARRKRDANRARRLRRERELTEARVKRMTDLNAQRAAHREMLGQAK